MSINIAVCDSNREIARDVKNLIDGEHIAATVKIFSSAEELLAEETFFHLCFLDIKGIDGLTLAQKIRLNDERQGKAKSIIIFVTGYSEHMEEAFDVQAFHYLLKPVNKEKFRRVLDCALKEIESLRQDEKYILVSATGVKNAPISKRKVLLKDIFYVESDNKKVIIHLKNEVLYAQGTMNEFENICGKSFYRCHRCYLVNFAQISAYSQNEITMENGDKIMLAYKRYTAFVRAYLSYAKGGGAVNV